MKILNFGSLNIDYVYRVDHFVRKGETISSRSLQVFSGGKGLNQSIALGRAGVPVFHAGCIGEDGRFLLEQLKEAGAEPRYVSVLSDIRTGNAIIQNDSSGDNCIILYGGANRAVGKQQIDLVLKDFSKGDWLLLQNETSCLNELIEAGHEKGMVIVLNPSPMDEVIRTVNLQHVDWFLLNEIEAAQLTGLPVNQCGKELLIQALQQQFPSSKILLTLGGEGSCCAADGQILNQPAYPVKAVDTTAAGDTFTGYFLSEVLRGGSVKYALDIASQAAAIAVSRRGAAPSIPWRDEIPGIKLI